MPSKKTKPIAFPARVRSLKGKMNKFRNSTAGQDFNMITRPKKSNL